MMRITKGTAEIQTVDDWRQHAPPRGGDQQWAKGRSAYELAQEWCKSGHPQAPQELREVLEKPFPHLQFLKAEPEYRIAFDKFRGEPRNTDLAICAQDNQGQIAISIEAKADEPFGNLTEDVLLSAARRIATEESTATKAIARVQQLAQALLPPHSPGLPPLGKLRYQLLTGLAGTLAHAAEIGASRAIFVVHEFVTAETQNRLRKRNSQDLAAFVQRLSGGAVDSLPVSTLTELFLVPGKPLLDAPCRLFIAKIQTVSPSANAGN